MTSEIPYESLQRQIDLFTQIGEDDFKHNLA